MKQSNGVQRQTGNTDVTLNPSEEFQNTKIFILAGGAGQRLGHLCTSYYRPLIPLGNRPLIWYTITLLKAQRFRDITILCRKSASETIEAAIGSYFDQDADFLLSVKGVIEDDDTRGSAQIILDQANSCREVNSVLVTSCDLIGDLDLTGFFEAHIRTQAGCTVLFTKSKHEETVLKCKPSKSTASSPTVIAGGEPNAYESKLPYAVLCNENEDDLGQLSPPLSMELQSNKSYRLVSLDHEAGLGAEDKPVSHLHPVLSMRYPLLEVRNDLMESFVYLFKAKTLINIMNADSERQRSLIPQSDLESLQFDLVPHLISQRQQADIEELLKASQTEANDTDRNVNWLYLDQYKPQVRQSYDQAGSSGVFCYIQDCGGSPTRVNNIAIYHELNTKKLTNLKPSEFEKYLPLILMPTSNDEFKGNRQVKDSIVGQNVVVEPGCVIKKSVIASDVTIKKNSRITNSVVMSGSIINEDANVRNSVLGVGVIVGSQAQITGCDIGKDFVVVPDSTYTLEELPETMDFASLLNPS